MPQFLKMPQLLDQHDMAEMQIGCSGIKSRLDPQGSPLLERGPDPILQLALLDHLNGAARDQVKLPFQFSIGHQIPVSTTYSPGDGVFGSM